MRCEPDGADARQEAVMLPSAAAAEGLPQQPPTGRALARHVGLSSTALLAAEPFENASLKPRRGAARSRPPRAAALYEQLAALQAYLPAAAASASTPGPPAAGAGEHAGMPAGPGEPRAAAAVSLSAPPACLTPRALAASKAMRPAARVPQTLLHAQ